MNTNKFVQYKMLAKRRTNLEIPNILKTNLKEKECGMSKESTCIHNCDARLAIQCECVRQSVECIKRGKYCIQYISSSVLYVPSCCCTPLNRFRFGIFSISF